MIGVIWENELHREASQRVFLSQRVNEVFFVEEKLLVCDSWSLYISEQKKTQRSCRITAAQQPHNPITAAKPPNSRRITKSIIKNFANIVTN